MKRFSLILFVFVILSACKDSSNFKIEGTITNVPEGKIYLEKLLVSGTEPLDSCTFDKNGSFEFKGSVSQPTFMLLKINDSKFVTLLVDSLEEISFSADYLNFSRDYKVEGSIGSLKVQELTTHLMRTNQRLDSIKALTEINAAKEFYEERLRIWNEEQAAICNEQIEYSRNFVTQNPFSMASLLALYQRFNNGDFIIQDLQTIRTGASALSSIYPNSEHVKALYQETSDIIKRSKNSQMQQVIEQYGSNSPEIELPNIKGDTIALSSFQGKYVLVQFWSAKDRTCRVMNPVLKENYTKFKSKGFEIYQVSVDQNEDDWLTAIEDDGLTWTNVGDMKGSVKAVLHYNIQTLPSNYLLGPNGEILGKNLFGPALHQKLSEILN